MRTFGAILTVSLVLGLISRPTFALRGSENLVALESIRMLDAQNGWARTYSSAGFGLLHTTDGGVTWEDARPVDPSGQRVAVALLDAYLNVAWAQSPELTPTGGLVHTTDGGRTWKNVPLPAMEEVKQLAVLSISFINAREGWLLATYPRPMSIGDVYAFRSSDGGETWTSVRIPGKGPSFAYASLGRDPRITFFDSMRGIITIGSPPYTEMPFIYVTQDGGYTWQQRSLPLPPPLYTRGLQPPPPDVSSDLNWGQGNWGQGPAKVFASKDGIMRVDYQNGDRGIAQFIKPMAVFYITPDSGTTWEYTTPLPLKPPSSDADIGFQPSDFADINNGWLADHNTLYATANSGRQWTVRTTGFPLAHQLNFVSSQVGWALRKVEFTTRTEPSLFKTADGGRTWTPIAYTISRP